MTGDGVLAATVGIGHGIPEVVPDVVRAGAMTVVDGGRCGCVAGEAFADGGFEVAELCPGEGAIALVAVGGAETKVVTGVTVVTLEVGTEADVFAFDSVAPPSSPRRRFVPRVVLSLRPNEVAFKRIWCLFRDDQQMNAWNQTDRRPTGSR